MIGLISTGLRLILFAVNWAKKRALLNEGARRQLAKDLSAVIEAGELASEVRQEIASMTDDQIDEIMRR